MDTIEATATVIETELLKQSEMDKWLDDKMNKVQKICSQYAPHAITKQSEYKQAKRERTSARKAIAEIEDARKEKTAAIKQAVKDFEARVKDVLEPLTSIDAGYKAEIDAWERESYQRKLAYVQQQYEELAPALVELVPFSRLRDAYSAAEKWENITTQEQTIVESIEAHVSQIASDEKAIDAMQLDAHDTKALKADYFSCLSLGDAMRRHTERKEQQKRVAALEAQRKAIDTTPTMTPEEYEHQTGQPAPVEPTILNKPEEYDEEPPAVAQAVKNPPVPQYVFCGYCNAEQAIALQDARKAIGISRFKLQQSNGKNYVLRSM